MSNKKHSTRPGRKARRDRYSAESRAEKNRERKLKAHLKKFPNDKQAQSALNKPRPQKNSPKGSLYPKVEIRDFNYKAKRGKKLNVII